MRENQNTEWKESWRDEWLKWLCGFANAKGGCAGYWPERQGESGIERIFVACREAE